MRRMRALGETEPLMRAVQLSAIANAKALVPRRTGFLQRAIIPGSVSATHAEVIANAPYAADVEYGTKPHDIVPKTKKALAWGGARRLTGSLRAGAKPDHFAKRVHHPGTKPKPYLVPGAKKAVADAGLRDAVVKAWNSGG